MRKTTCFVELAKQIKKETQKVTKKDNLLIHLNGLRGVLPESNNFNYPFECSQLPKQKRF